MQRHPQRRKRSPLQYLHWLWPCSPQRCPPLRCSVPRYPHPGPCYHAATNPDNPNLSIASNSAVPTGCTRSTPKQRPSRRPTMLFHFSSPCLQPLKHVKVILTSPFWGQKMG